MNNKVIYTQDVIDEIDRCLYIERLRLLKLLNKYIKNEYSKIYQDIKQEINSIYSFDLKIAKRTSEELKREIDRYPWEIDLEYYYSEFKNTVESYQDEEIISKNVEQWFLDRLQEIYDLYVESIFEEKQEKQTVEYIYSIFEDKSLPAIKQKFIDLYLFNHKSNIYNKAEKVETNIDTLGKLVRGLKNKDELESLEDLSYGDLADLSPSTMNKIKLDLKNHEFIEDICRYIGNDSNDNSTNEESTFDIDTDGSDRFNFMNITEMTSIKYGNDISLALKYQLGMQRNPKLKKLFKLAFAEKKLLELELSCSYVEKEKGPIVKKEDIEHGRGDIIICVDTSGSMWGQNERIAKAFCYQMASIARQENRKCYIINFSTQLDEIDVSGKEKFLELMNFLSKSFNGGTNVDIALERSIEIINEENYSNADIIVISDFDLGHIKNNVINDIYKQKEAGNRFFGLMVNKWILKPSYNHYGEKEWPWLDYFFKFNFTEYSKKDIVEAVRKLEGK